MLDYTKCYQVFNIQCDALFCHNASSVGNLGDTMVDMKKVSPYYKDIIYRRLQVFMLLCKRCRWRKIDDSPASEIIVQQKFTLSVS